MYVMLIELLVYVLLILIQMIMNKKFSTLVGCLAFGTAFSAVAQVSNFPVSNAYGQVTPCVTGLTYRSFGTKSNATLGSEVNKIEADKWYQLRVGEEKNQVLIQERDFKTGEVTLRIVDADKAPLNYSLWQISYDKKDGATGGKFTFKNKETGLGIIFDHKTAYGKDKIATTATSADLKASILEGCNVEWSWFSSNVDNTQKLANEILYANFHDSDKYIVLKKSSRTAANQYGLNISGNQVVAAVYTAAEAGNKATSCEALTLTPVVAESVVLNAKDINRMIDAQKDGAAGFNFMTPTGIGNRTAMSPEDNSTLDTYKYIAEEKNLTAEADEIKLAADKAIIAAGNTVLSEYNAEDGSEAKELNFIFANFNQGESQDALVQAGSDFAKDKSAEKAKVLVEKWVVYLEETATDQLWALSDANKAYYVKHTDKTVIEDYNFAVAVVAHKDLYNKYPLRLKAAKVRSQSNLAV